LVVIPHLQDVDDLADVIFGRLQQDDAPESASELEKGGLKSRISFGHATCVDAVKPQPVQQPAGILSSPKPSFTPAYLRQPDSHPQTGAMAFGKPYRTYDDARSMPAGWKRYPVRPAARVQPMPPDLAAKKKQQVQLHTLPPGVRFRFKVRIHNMRPHELGAVLWALLWGEDARLAHALGMGKPWGFGQVRCKISADTFVAGLSRADGGETPTASACIAAYRDMMESFVKEHMPQAGSWSASDQIETLRAMADPRKAEILPTGVPVGPAGRLESMPLADFAARKGAKGGQSYALRPYVPLKHSGGNTAGVIDPSRSAAPSNPAGAKPSALATGQPAASGNDPVFARGSRIYAAGEDAELLEDVTAAMISARKRVRISYGAGDEDDVPAHLIKARR
jgi:hypothetical protein